MTLNEMICPTCGHVSYTECSYVTCAGCGTTFYAAQAGRRPVPNAAMTVQSPSAFRVMVQNGNKPVTVIPVHSHAGANGG